MGKVGAHVYVIGAGFSAGLGFPTISNLLSQLWPSIKKAGLAADLAAVIRFHHPSFNSSRPDTFPDVETLLSEMRANEQLFASSRPATGNFTAAELTERRQGLLLQVADQFHELQAKALSSTPLWLDALVGRMRKQNAQIISFNWDLVLDQLLFGDALSKSSYGFTKRSSQLRLIKPHGSLNWYSHEAGKHLKSDRKFKLCGHGDSKIYAFKPYRAPSSSRRSYMPFIVPPVFSKSFEEDIFNTLWQEAVSTLSTAASVTFLGYSLADADFHARFILRCGFHNQVDGALRSGGGRRSPTGQAAVTIVDLDDKVGPRIEAAVGWPCDFYRGSIEDWVTSLSA
jgi:hypothetical protein